MKKPKNAEHLIAKPKQLVALQSPARLRIVEYLASRDAASIADIAGWMGVGPHGLYHHLKVLREARLVRPAGERGSGRKAEKLYRLAAPRLRADPSNKTPSYLAALAGVGASILRKAARNFEAAMRSKRAVIEGGRRDTAVRHAVLRLSPPDLASLNRDMEELFRRYDAAKSNAKTAREIALTIVMTPRRG